MAVDVNIYKDNPAAAIKEILRAKQVATDNKNDPAKVKAASDWANNIRNVSGVDNSLYGSGVNSSQATQNYKTAYADKVNQAIDSTKGNANNDVGIVTPGSAEDVAHRTAVNKTVASGTQVLPGTSGTNPAMGSPEWNAQRDKMIATPTTTGKTPVVKTSDEIYAEKVKIARDEFKASGGDPDKDMTDWTAKEEKRVATEAEAIRARVRAAIAEGTNAQNKIINEAPGQFVDPMNRASFQGAKDAQAIDERMAAMGLGRSGSNITAQTSNANQTQANINDLEGAKAKVISDAQAAIAQLQASGSLEEVRLVQEAAAKSLDRIQSQINVTADRKSNIATALLNNATDTAGTEYEIKASNRGLDMQERDLGAKITGIDGKTGEKTYDAQKDDIQNLAEYGGQWFNPVTGKMEDTAEQKSFNRQQTFTEDRAKVADQQWVQQFNSQEEQRLFENDLNLEKFDFDKESVKWEQTFKTNEFNWTKVQKEIENGFTKRTIDIDEKYKNGQLSLQQKELAHKINTDNRQLNLESAKFAWSKASARSSGGRSGGRSGKTTQWEANVGKDDLMGQFANQLKGNSFTDAYGKLNSEAGDIISQIGADRYNDLWNTVLSEGIDSGWTVRGNKIPYKKGNISLKYDSE